MGLEQGQHIQPLEGGSLQATVVQVVAVDVDSCSQATVPRSEKTGLRRLFPLRDRWSSHTAIAGKLCSNSTMLTASSVQMLPFRPMASLMYEVRGKVIQHEQRAVMHQEQFNTQGVPYQEGEVEGAHVMQVALIATLAVLCSQRLYQCKPPARHYPTRTRRYDGQCPNKSAPAPHRRQAWPTGRAWAIKRPRMTSKGCDSECEGTLSS